MVGDDGWEVCELWHDGKHKIKLSIHTKEKYRNTYCISCGHSVLFERVNPRPTGRCNIPAQCAKGWNGFCYSNEECEGKI